MGYPKDNTCDDRRLSTRNGQTASDHHHRFGLTVEPSSRLPADGKSGWKNLDRNLPFETGVPCMPDFPHSACADFFRDLEMSEE